MRAARTRGPGGKRERSFRFIDFFQSLKDHGYVVELIEYVEWRRKLMVCSPPPSAPAAVRWGGAPRALLPCSLLQPPSDLHVPTPRL